MEGINRKIKTMLRQFYGLHDNDFLRLKLYALHESNTKLSDEAYLLRLQV
jgi:hypothetical protein